MYTLKEISLNYNIALETLRKRAYLLKLEPIHKKAKSKASVYDDKQVYKMLEYKNYRNSKNIQFIYIDRSFKETITETYYIYPSKMNYE